MNRPSTRWMPLLCLTFAAMALTGCQGGPSADSQDKYIFLATADFPETDVASLGRAADAVIPAQRLRIRNVYRTRSRILYQLLTVRLEVLELAIDATGRYSSRVEILGKRYKEQDEAKKLLEGLRAQLVEDQFDEP